MVRVDFYFLLLALLCNKAFIIRSLLDRNETNNDSFIDIGQYFSSLEAAFHLLRDVH